MCWGKPNGIQNVLLYTLQACKGKIDQMLQRIELVYEPVQHFTLPEIHPIKRSFVSQSEMHPAGIQKIASCQ